MKAPERRARQEGASTLREAFLRSSDFYAPACYLQSLDPPVCELMDVSIHVALPASSS
jgi:hypothetical protein